MMDGLVGALAYWAIGWAVAYGPSSNGFIGEANFFRLSKSCSLNFVLKASLKSDAVVTLKMLVIIWRHLVNSVCGGSH